MIYVVLYLAAIVLANILILLYNPDTVSMTWALVAETGISFFLIGLDLSIRDKLHDYWQNRNLWPKMVTLIVSGSLITVLFNLGQFVAKLFGGALWAFVIDHFRGGSENTAEAAV